uniref:Uncharacterized protein n=1 Tax=Rhizophora mucronata TaxID=61149 RepID=A0A2P2K453_RHIMU
MPWCEGQALVYWATLFKFFLCSCQVTKLREYQGVDPHFDTIARQYHDIVKKLENMQWTIHQVEMDLKRLPDHPNA